MGGRKEPKNAETGTHGVSYFGLLALHPLCSAGSRSLLDLRVGARVIRRRRWIVIDMRRKGLVVRATDSE